MAVPSSGNNMNEFGIIILGNSGAGKSYLCNILIGHDKFKHNFQPGAVTTDTEVCVITDGSKCMKIFNIPGLVENKQERINRNKREIMKAFEQCEKSVVIFAWRQTGGRLQEDDIIAFNALRDAYAFVKGSLMFMVNDLPRRRPPEYNGKFFQDLSVALQPIPVTMDDVIFIDSMEPEEIEKREKVRSSMFELIGRHHAAQHKIHGEIILQADKLEKMREEMEKKIMAAQQDREAYEKKIQDLTKQFERARQEADERVEKIRGQINNNAQNPGPFAYLGMALDAAGRTVLDFLKAPDNVLLGGSKQGNCWPTGASVAVPIAAVVATPIAVAAGGIQGGVRGAASGFNTMVDPLANFISDSDNPVVLRAVAAPVAVASGTIGLVGGAAVGAVEGTVKGIGSVFRSIFGD